MVSIFSSNLKEKKDGYPQKLFLQDIRHLKYHTRWSWHPTGSSYAPSHLRMWKLEWRWMWERVLVYTHLFVTHELCMTWISQEHLPFTFSLGLNSLVQNQLLNAPPGPELTWQSIYLQPRSKTKNRRIIWHYYCDTIVIKKLSPIYVHDHELYRAQEVRYCLCVLLVLQEVSVFVCAKLDAVPARIYSGGFSEV